LRSDLQTQLFINVAEKYYKNIFLRATRINYLMQKMLLQAFCKKMCG